jgi:DMATS type aromatic prenyltransferase
MKNLSLFEHLHTQLINLCKCLDINSAIPRRLLAELLGATGSRSLSEPPAWPSNIADDHTPVEFSVAFSGCEPPSLRILGESQPAQPNPATILASGLSFLDLQKRRYGLSTSRFDLVRDLFVTSGPPDRFTLWHSLIFRNCQRPEFKVYLNPEIRGREAAADLVCQALSRLGMGQAQQTLIDKGILPNRPEPGKRLAFFALDLHERANARVKLYLSHERTTTPDLIRMASVVDGIAAEEIADFCWTATGSAGPYAHRPLVSSYTFAAGRRRPIGYSLYVPIRGYVNDDSDARDRVALLMKRYGFDPVELDRVIAAVARRPVDGGVGLIAHTSLRLGPPRPGLTVYLSSEAYQVAPPRRARQPRATKVTKSIEETPQP